MKKEKFTVLKQVRFCYGHRVPNHKSKCRNVHGHEALLEVLVEGPLVHKAGASDEGMVLDFGDIKRAMEERIVAPLDHRFIMWEKDEELRQLLVPGTSFSDRARSGQNAIGKVYLVQGFGWVQEMDEIPTAENLARLSWDLLSGFSGDPRVVLKSVRFWETPTSCARFNG